VRRSGSSFAVYTEDCDDEIAKLESFGVKMLGDPVTLALPRRSFEFSRREAAPLWL
jgi:hypothetical protein